MPTYVIHDTKKKKTNRLTPKATETVASDVEPEKIESDVLDTESVKS